MLIRKVNIQEYLKIFQLIHTVFLRAVYSRLDIKLPTVNTDSLMQLNSFFMTEFTPKWEKNNVLSHF